MTISKSGLYGFVNPFILLKEAQKTEHCVLHAQNVSGIVLLIPELISRLSKYKEIAIDETYGTNNSGMGLRICCFGTCSCPTKVKSFETKGRLEMKDKKERDVVAGIFSRHLNSHPAFPDINGIYKDSLVICRESVQEIYVWCRPQGVTLKALSRSI